jgi:hypothetical protein
VWRGEEEARSHLPHSNSATAVVKAPCPRIGAILGLTNSVCLTHPERPAMSRDLAISRSCIVLHAAVPGSFLTKHHNTVD